VAMDITEETAAARDRPGHREISEQRIHDF